MAYQYLIDESAVRKIDESVQRIVDATDGLVASSPDLETANATIDGLKQLNARRKHDLIKLWDEHEELTKERDELRKDLELTRQQLQGSTRGSALATDTIFKTKKILGGGDFDSLPGVAQRVMNEFETLVTAREQAEAKLALAESQLRIRDEEDRVRTEMIFKTKATLGGSASDSLLEAAQRVMNELARLRLEIAELGAGRSASLSATKEAREARDKAIVERDQARSDTTAANACILNQRKRIEELQQVLGEQRRATESWQLAAKAAADARDKAIAERNAPPEDFSGLTRRVRATEAQRDGALANLEAANKRLRELEKVCDSRSSSADHWQRRYDTIYHAFWRLRSQVAAAAEAPIPEPK